MKKLFVTGAFISLAIVSYSVSEACALSNLEGLSEVALSNIETLSSDETPSGAGSYTEIKTTTEYVIGGIPQKYVKNVRCEPGGGQACTEGSWYKYLKDDGTWSDWIPN